MANAFETTFKNLQLDERYKKLERTLKMALLKNAERRNIDNGNAGTWPNVSSINGDHLDSSIAAMSVQSSRVGSEVVSSSANFRNNLSKKQHFVGLRNNAATSSENQFPMNKNNVDSIMMPPPSTPGVDFGKPKRFSAGTQRAPLVNMPVNSGRNTNGFSMSTPASSISSIPKCVGSVKSCSTGAFQENNDYGRIAYGDAGCVQKQERSFYKWRVLLNDKGLLIIKGTLECGKVARSKPVIRRLTPTSVQSVYKHTYHLHGNLVDDRGELPDYVRGKFYNGFPDDWENVYEVWRDFVNDGNRLSFRWPTPVTDSEDDLRSEITDMTYRPERYKKSVSPRKRVRSVKSSSVLDLSETDIGNRPDPKPCSCSHNASAGTPGETSTREKHRSPDKLSRGSSKGCRQQHGSTSDNVIEEQEKSYDASSTMNKSNVNSLSGIIPEDKFNIIIDNLTDKNCPLEYINKIVEMFDCMKYIVSYQSAVENGPEKNSALIEKEVSRTPSRVNRSTEENRDVKSTPSSTNPVNTPHNSMQKQDQHDKQLGSAVSVPNEESYKNRSQSGRRKLAKHDYESSESDNDFYEDSRGNRPVRFPTPNKKLRKTRHKNPAALATSRTNKQHTDAEELSENSRRQCSEAPVARKQTHNSSISEEEYVVERKSETKLGNSRALTSPRKIAQAGKENRMIMKHYDSSVSFTEDDEQYTNKSRVKEIRDDNFDSSVSITEDEHGDARDQNCTRSRHYYAAHNAHRPGPHMYRNEYSDYYPSPRPLDKSASRNGESRDARKRLNSLDYYPDAIDRPVGRDIEKSGNISNDRRQPGSPNFLAKANSHRDERIDRSRNAIPHNSRVSRNMPPFGSPFVGSDNCDLTNDSNPTCKTQGHVPWSNADNHPTEPEDDSAYMSAEMKRSKKLNSNAEPAEFESSKSYINSRSNPPLCEQSPKSPEISPPKTKTPQIKKKLVVSLESAEVHLQTANRNETNAGKIIDKIDENSTCNLVNELDRSTPPVAANNPSVSRNSPADTPEKTHLADSGKSKKRSNEINANKVQDDKDADNTPIAEYGSEKNPKLLTAWVPAVICDIGGDNKCYLIFEGKLLNEAGHVVSRKFVTDTVIRRLTPKVIETCNHHFYKLVGDLNDTKHVVPKELTKQCRNGCPSRIPTFCDKWKSLTGETYTSPPRERSHNKSIDCLSVPRSSRGRRILPPLNYWAGERVVTKDNKTLYSPGHSQESSIPSSLEQNTSRESPNKHSPKGRSRTSTTKKKSTEKMSTPRVGKSTADSPSTSAQGSQKTLSGSRRMTKNKQVSSSESDDSEEAKATPRKRKTRINDKVVVTENSSARKLRISDKMGTPSQGNKNSSVSPKKGSKKRQKMDDNQGTLQQFITRRPAEIKCTYYKSVPMRDGDLSEDQLSTM